MSDGCSSKDLSNTRGKRKNTRNNGATSSSHIARTKKRHDNGCNSASTDKKNLLADMVEREKAVQAVENMKAMEAVEDVEGVEDSEGVEDVEDMEDVEEEMEAVEEGSDENRYDGDGSSGDEWQAQGARWDAQLRKNVPIMKRVWLGNEPFQNDMISFLDPVCRVHCHKSDGSWFSCGKGSKCKHKNGLTAIYQQPPEELMKDPKEYHHYNIDGKSKKSMSVHVKVLGPNNSSENELVPLSALRLSKYLTQREVVEHTTKTVFGSKAFQSLDSTTREQQKLRTTDALKHLSQHENPFGFISPTGHAPIRCKLRVEAEEDGFDAIFYDINLLSSKVKQKDTEKYLCIWIETSKHYTPQEIAKFFKICDKIEGLLVLHVSTKQDDEKKVIQCCRKTMEPTVCDDDSGEELDVELPSDGETPDAANVAEDDAQHDAEATQDKKEPAQDLSSQQVMALPEKSSKLIQQMTNPSVAVRTNNYDASVRVEIALCVKDMLYRNELEEAVFLNCQMGNTCEKTLRNLNDIVNLRKGDGGFFYEFSAGGDQFMLRTGKIPDYLLEEPPHVLTEELDDKQSTGFELQLHQIQHEANKRSKLTNDLFNQVTILQLKDLYRQMEIKVQGKTKKAHFTNDLIDKGKNDPEIAEKILKFVEEMTKKKRENQERCKQGNTSSGLSDSAESSEYAESEESGYESSDDDVLVQEGEKEEDHINNRATTQLSEACYALGDAFKNPTRVNIDKAMQDVLLVRNETQDLEQLHSNLQNMRNVQRSEYHSRSEKRLERKLKGSIAKHRKSQKLFRRL